MQSFSVEEEDVFFDSFDRTPIDSSPDCSLVAEEQEFEFRKLDSEFWKRDVTSVRERRKKFLLGMGLDEFVSSPLSGCSPETKECDQSVDNMGLERVTESSGAVLDSLSSRDDGEQKDSACCIKDLDSGKKFVIHDLGHDGYLSMLKEVGSNKLISLQEFETLLGLSRSVQKFMRKEPAPLGERLDGSLNGRLKKQKKGWWRRFIPKRPLVGICKNDVSVKSSKLPRTIRAKVLRHKKKCLEFTALYMGQEIQAHEGVIRTMKFSTSGCYLTSGGEDCVVRIWQVREAEDSCKCSVADGSCDFDDKVKDRSMLGRKGIDSAPVVIPKKVFMIDETPLQELYGHTSDVLDLSWSNYDCLLTSSMDKTVRLWKVGCDGCLKVFQHNDYVTCVQFNPVDDEYFISGSIDGKVRIWGISENHVVDWADARDIVTSVCYRPDGEGFVVGSVMGNCRFYNYSGSFYNYSGNSLQLETQFCVQGRKKSAAKPITGLQFSPEDSQRIMITSADSRVRIFDGVDVIHKFRGLRKTKSQLSASFTLDGRYIVSVGEDSTVYIWNYDLSGRQSSKGVKSVRSCELFSSADVSLAVPWPGMNHRDSDLSTNSLHLPSQPVKLLEPSTWLWDSDFCSLGAWLFADGISKGSATWPEEKLAASPRHALEVKDHYQHRSDRHRDHWYRMHQQYRRLTHLSATWSLVIVTASCDGTIRSFHNYGLPVRLGQMMEG